MGASATPADAYADFLAMVGELGSKKTSVFYYSNGVDTFAAWAFLGSGTILRVNYPGAGGPPPASFSTDFPHAIALTAGFL
jgi:hypothetical protein